MLYTLRSEQKRKKERKKERRDDLDLTTSNPGFSSFLVSSNHLSRKSRYQPEDLSYQMKDTGTPVMPHI